MSHFTPFVASGIDDIWYFVNTRDAGIGRSVFGEGSYEFDEMAFAFDLADKYSPRPPALKGRTFIDIGANIGTTVIPALLNFGAENAVALEPETDNYKLLRSNLIFNELEDRVVTAKLALSDCEGVGTLEHDGGGGDHRIRMNTALPDGTYHESRRRTMEVQLATFDQVVEELAIDLEQVGLVWMDTQGHEGHILAGAQSLLTSDIPVVLEYWPYGLRRAEGLEMLHQLISMHYRIVIDLRCAMREGVVEMPASDIGNLAERYPGETYTDLLLVS